MVKLTPSLLHYFIIKSTSLNSSYLIEIIQGIRYSAPFDRELQELKLEEAASVGSFKIFTLLREVN